MEQICYKPKINNAYFSSKIENNQKWIKFDFGKKLRKFICL